MALTVLVTVIVASLRAIPALGHPNYLKFRDAHFSTTPGARTDHQGGELWCQLNIHTIGARSVLAWQCTRTCA